MIDFYLFFGILITFVLSFSFIRLFFKRLTLYIKLKRNPDYVLETKLSDFFSPTRISQGFSLIQKGTNKKYRIYIIAAYNRRETLEFTDKEYCVKKLFYLIGGRIGSGASFSWYTPLKNIPDFIKSTDNNSLILLSPAPLALRYNGREIYLGDKMLGKELVNATKLKKM